MHILFDYPITHCDHYGVLQILTLRSRMTHSSGILAKKKMVGKQRSDITACQPGIGVLTEGQFWQVPMADYARHFSAHPFLLA